MAFPVLQTADTQSGSVTSNSASWTLTYPTNLVSGDLILLLAGVDGDAHGASGVTLPSGWARAGRYLNPNANAQSDVVAGKVSNGTETGNFTLDLAGSEQGVWRVHRITGWQGTLFADGNSINPGAINADGIAVSGAVYDASTTTPDPPSLNPANWDVEDTLWIAFMGADHGNTTVTGWPTNYDAYADVAQESGGAGGAGMGIAYRNLAAASDDPGTFTIDAGEQSGAMTIAIRPAAAAPSLLLPNRNQMIIRR